MIEKSFKREVACIALLFWVLLTVFYFGFIEDVEFIKAYTPAYTAATGSIFLLVAGMFGIHGKFKPK